MTNTDKIRELNDAFRKDFLLGKAVMTSGVQALGPNILMLAIGAIANFAEFCDENDPHDEHDFGAIEVGGNHLFFKIDYYNPTFDAHSPDPADPRVTSRVLTLMLVDEY